MDDTGSMESSIEASPIGSWARVRNRDLPSKGKKFKYTWDFSDGSSGFIVQRKTKNNKQFQMYLDANEDGVFNRSDRLVVGGKLSRGYRNSKPGDLIDFSDTALITAKPYDPVSNSRRVHSSHDKSGHDKSSNDKSSHDKSSNDKSSHDKSSHDKSSNDQSEQALLGINELGYQHLSFLDTDMNQVFHDHGAAHAAHHHEMI